MHEDGISRIYLVSACLRSYVVNVGVRWKRLQQRFVIYYCSQLAYCALKDRLQMKKRRDTRLEAEGAEFLVVGWLLINGIEAHKTYSKMPGYDLIAVNAKDNKSCRIQVKCPTIGHTP